MSSRLEVICGPMFSGKSEELIRRINRERIARREVLVIKPYVDTRTENFIASRAVNDQGESYITDKIEAHVLKTCGEIWNLLKSHHQTLAIDEAQFCGEGLPSVVRTLLHERSHEEFAIMVSGLDTDFAHRPFGPMGTLLAMADDITKLTAICMKCFAREARLTQRIGGNRQQVQVGDRRDYEVRCRQCYELPDIR